ncbi:MAG: squalene/phytoene synthase family protein, partial [Gemmatimonadetes bacterium]|nr:squalene/phytoene synthase family protein [Gemmatimonadota bacterium]
AAAFVHNAPAAASLYVLGRRTGELYQMLDDLLDYCPDVDTGKPPLGDYAQRRWTWPLLELKTDGFDEEPAAVAERLAQRDASGSSALRRCLLRFEREADAVRAAIAVHMPSDEILTTLVLGWLARAEDAVASVEAARDRRHVLAELQRRLPDEAELQAFFAENSRTFSFAARAFPAEFRARVAGVYAFCRITDDIADDAIARAVNAGTDTFPHNNRDGTISVESRTDLLDLWCELARASHAGTEAGLPLLDRVMREAALAAVPFPYVEELIEGMRMDLRGQRYPSLPALRVYSYRVAGVIGQWLTRMCGVHDAAVLARAADLGHAMQLTNIVRDVGEDLNAGRVYLPADMLADAGLDEQHLHAFAAGEPVTQAYRALLEDLMAAADAHYAAALSAAHALPKFFRRAIVVAAHVYRGIHDEVRANGYDNFNRRAHTTTPRKIVLAVQALRAANPVTPVRGARTAISVESAHAEIPAKPRFARAQPAGPRPAFSEAAAPLPAKRAGRRMGSRIVTAIMLGAAALPPALAAQAVDPISGGWSEAERGAASAWDRHLARVRSVYFEAVDDEAAMSSGRAAIAEARSAMPRGGTDEALLLAYEGAFTALEAKHGSWPIARFLTVRNALQLLDAAVQAAPHDLEIRYLRMINGYHLPSLFGRGDQAANDLTALERALPGAEPCHSPDVFRAMAAFVLEHGAPADADREALSAAIRRIDTRPREQLLPGVRRIDTRPREQLLPGERRRDQRGDPS